jgi:hypothetical protein
LISDPTIIRRLLLPFSRLRPPEVHDITRSSVKRHELARRERPALRCAQGGMMGHEMVGARSIADLGGTQRG